MKIRSNFEVFKVYRAPVFAHWTVLLAFPIGWAIEKSILGAVVAQVAFLVLILAHEIGHAFVAHLCGLRVHSLRLFAFHGACIYGAPRREASNIAVAWGGVAAQAVLFFMALLIAKVFSLTGGIPQALSPAFDVLVPVNMLVAFCNLLPFPPLDGAKAWRFIPRGISAAVARVRKRIPPDETKKVVSKELNRISKK